MKKGILLLCWLNVFTYVYAQETVQLTSGEWPPYLSKTLDHYGIASRIVTEAFAEVGISAEYGFFLWQRAYNQAKAGRWDGSIIWLKSPEREQHFYFSDAVIESRVHFFHYNDYSFDWNQITDLKGILIGATESYYYGEDFENAEKTGIINVQRTAKDLLNIRKLLKGRIQIFPHNLAVGYYQLRQLFPPEQAKRLTHHPKPLQVRFLHLILSKKVEKNKHRLILFNKGLSQLKENGKLDLYKQEFLKAW